MNRWFNRLTGRASALAATLVGVTFFGSLAYAIGIDDDWIEAEGVVQELSLADSTVLIDGLQYRVVPHAKVQVRGRDSSFAGLQVGMQVLFFYESFEGLRAEVAALEEGLVIHEIEQLPDNVQVMQY